MEQTSYNVLVRLPHKQDGYSELANLGPIGAIERSVLNGFAEVARLDI
jgi:hypothetical protein